MHRLLGEQNPHVRSQVLVTPPTLALIPTVPLLECFYAAVLYYLCRMYLCIVLIQAEAPADISQERALRLQLQALARTPRCTVDKGCEAPAEFVNESPITITT